MWYCKRNQCFNCVFFLNFTGHLPEALSLYMLGGMKFPVRSSNLLDFLIDWTNAYLIESQKQYFFRKIELSFINGFWCFFKLWYNISREPSKHISVIYYKWPNYYFRKSFTSWYLCHRMRQLTSHCLTTTISLNLPNLACCTFLPFPKLKKPLKEQLFVASR